MNEFHGGPQCEANGTVSGSKDGKIPAQSILLEKSAESKRALQEQWPIFAEEVLARLHVGAEAYGDQSFQREPGELLVEIEQELFDVMGWGFILWCRLEKIKKSLLLNKPPRTESMTL